MIAGVDNLFGEETTSQSGLDDFRDSLTDFDGDTTGDMHTPITAFRCRPKYSEPLIRYSQIT